jgi:hypothetical protein
MRKIAYLMAVLFLTVGFPSLSGYGDETNKRKDESPKKVGDLMRQKLENSQKVLEGLVVNDFKMIAKHADELIDLSKQVEWKVLKTPQYEIHSNQFRRSAEALIKDAKDKNLDAAALTYMELTLTCVRCHKYVREERMTRLDLDSRSSDGGE